MKPAIGTSCTSNHLFILRLSWQCWNVELDYSRIAYNDSFSLKKRVIPSHFLLIGQVISFIIILSTEWKKKIMYKFILNYKWYSILTVSSITTSSILFIPLTAHQAINSQCNCFFPLLLLLLSSTSASTTTPNLSPKPRSSHPLFQMSNG